MLCVKQKVSVLPSKLVVKCLYNRPRDISSLNPAPILTHTRTHNGRKAQKPPVRYVNIVATQTIRAQGKVVYL